MKHQRSCLVAACLATLVLVQFASADTPFSRRNPIVEAVQKTRNSIVTVRVPRPNGARDMIGTGVIIDERGFILTNRHVVAGAREVKIRLADGTELAAEIQLAEPRWDLAVLRIRTTRKLTPMRPAPAKDLMVGETVIAIGNPFSYTETVSTGIVSALGREITMPTGDVLKEMIQTTAPINPGNSGGPLLNVNGEFIGINTAMREGAQNIAFAINAETITAFLQQNLSATKMSGIEHGLQCSEKILAETGDRQRVVVDRFQGEGILAVGDVLVRVGNCAVVNAFDVERAFWGYKPGAKVALKIVRQGQEMNVTLILTASNGAGQMTAQLPQAVGPQGTVVVKTENVPAAGQR